MSHFRWKLTKRYDDENIRNAHQLATAAGLSYPVANRVWKNEPFTRLDAPTINALAECFGVTRAKAMTIVELID